jgi:hypothetical protein
MNCRQAVPDAPGLVPPDAAILETKIGLAAVWADDRAGILKTRNLEAVARQTTSRSGNGEIAPAAASRFSHWSAPGWLGLLARVPNGPMDRTMIVPGESQKVAAKRAAGKGRQPCQFCERGKLDLIDERPDPIFGALGMTCQTLRCDAPECGKLTFI